MSGSYQKACAIGQRVSYGCCSYVFEQVGHTHSWSARINCGSGSDSIGSIRARSRASSDSRSASCVTAAQSQHICLPSCALEPSGIHESCWSEHSAMSNRLMATVSAASNCVVIEFPHSSQLNEATIQSRLIFKTHRYGRKPASEYHRIHSKQ